jgi:hypothetical protein
MITNKDIESVYDKTTVKTRVVTFDYCMMNTNGEKLNAMCEVLQTLMFQNSKWGSLVNHSDGGIKDFFITYKIGQFEILVWRVMSMETSIGTTTQSFCDFLNKMEKRIIATMTLELN